MDNTTDLPIALEISSAADMTQTHTLWMGASDPRAFAVSEGDIWINDGPRIFGLYDHLMNLLYSGPFGYTPDTAILHPSTYAALKRAADRAALDGARRRARMYAQRPRNMRKHAARLAKLAENHPQGSHKGYRH